MAGGMDMSGFLAGVEEARRRMLAVAERSVDVFAEQVIGDAQQLTPVATGALQGSGTTLPIEVGGDSIHKEIGFNTAYAVFVHEDLEARHDVGQAKYLSAAMEADAPRLAPFIASQLKGAGF